MSTTPDRGSGRTRRSSADRKIELAEVASHLFASRSFCAVTVDDIGDAVGLTGPALYRHFSSKDALLVAVFDHVVERWTDGVKAVLAATQDPREAIRALMRRHAELAIEEPDSLRVWRQEFHNLPETDAWRLRRAQSLYIEEWVDVVHVLRPDLNEAAARAMVRATMSLLESPSSYSAVGLASEELLELLTRMAVGVVLGDGAGEIGGTSADQPLKKDA